MLGGSTKLPQMWQVHPARTQNVPLGTEDGKSTSSRMPDIHHVWLNQDNDESSNQTVLPRHLMRIAWVKRTTHLGTSVPPRM